MMTVSISGADEVERKVRELANAVPNRVAAALRMEAETVMAYSKANYVPVMTGALKSSGHVQPAVITGSAFGAKEISVTLGYGGAAAKYALAVHENPRSGKTNGWGEGGMVETAEGGSSWEGIQFRWIKGHIVPLNARRKNWARVGEWKYLERPFLMRVSGFAARVKARVLQEGM